MPDLDQRVADGLRELVHRAPADADVWQATERYVARHRRQRHTILGAVVTVALLAGGLATAAIVRGGDSKAVPLNPGPTTETTVPSPNGTALPPTGPIDGEITITALPSIKFAPSSLTLHTGIYRLTFVDGSAAAHTLDFEDPNTLWSPQMVNRQAEAKTSRIYFGQPGDYTFFCAIPGHRAAGEQGVIHVSGPPMTLAQAEAIATTTVSWNVPVSRSNVIAKAQRVAGEGDGPHTIRTKLMTYGDFQSASAPGVVTPGTPDSLQIWAVEVTGKLYVPMAGPSSWAIWTYDAHDGSIVGVTAGPSGTSPTYWDSLPDHSSS